MLRDRLFARLDLTDTAFVPPADTSERFATASARDPDSGPPMPDRPLDRAATFDGGGGCASGTALNYRRVADCH